MSQNLQVIQLGNPILRQKSLWVENIHDPNIQSLIDDLMATVAQANGVGIAAPQVEESYRLFIVASRPNSRYPNAPEMQPTVMINPSIIAYSSEIVKGWEGCLSVPGIRGLVPRYERIEVEFADRNGYIKKQEFTGFIARIFQHEYDHLQGMVFLDRVESVDDLMTEAEYQQRIVNQKF
jgi:peptide deformylase